MVVRWDYNRENKIYKCFYRGKRFNLFLNTPGTRKTFLNLLPKNHWAKEADFT
jgi:hypothetical protein